MIALGLAALTVVLLWPVPFLLARSHLALRHPAAALVAWQAIGLGTGLAAICAGLAYGLAGPSPAPLVATAALGAYLLGVAAWVGARTLVRRRRHRAILDLVSTPLPEFPGGRLLDSPTAMVYCLPGLRPRMVVTSAALAGLSPSALTAVVAHERAHLHQHHDLVTLPFVAWHTALPFLPGARTARSAVALLVEILADDAARARVGTAPLRDALISVVLSGAPSEAGTEAPGTEAPGATALRLSRLR